jgi:hypothetical protein
MNINKKLLVRLLSALAITFLLVSITPYILLSKYTEAFADDYTVGLVLRNSNFFVAQIQWYTSWTGRYTAHALMSLLHPITYGNLHGLWLYAILMQGIFYSSIYFFIKSLLPSLSTPYRLFVLAIILMQYFWLIPSSSEAFNWIPSSFSYQLGASLNLCFFALLLRNRLFDKLSKILLVFLAVLIPGTSEINLFIFCFGLFLTTVYFFWNEKRIDRFLLYLLGIGVCFSLISLFSPGNNNRTAILKEISNGHPGDILFAIKAAIVISKQQITMLLLHSPFLIINVLFLIALKYSGIKPITKPSFPLIFLFLFIFIGTYLFLHILFPYKSGIIYMPERLLNITYLFFILCWFAFITLLWFAFISENDLIIESNKSSYMFPVTSMLMLGVFCLSQLLLPNKIQNAWRDLLSGDAKRYSEQVHDRINLMKDSQGKHLHIAPIVPMPYSICSCDIETDSTNWKNQALAEYFNLASVSIDSTLNNK